MFLLVACEPGVPTFDEGVGETAREEESARESGDPGESGETHDSGESAETGDTSPGSDHFADLDAEIDPEVVTLVHVRWTQLEATEEVWVEFGLEGEDLLTSPRRPGLAGEHSEVLLGVPASSDVSWRVVGSTSAGTERSSAEVITTGQLPRELPAVEIVAWDPTLATEDRWMLGSLDEGTSWYQGPFWAFVLDRQGRYVWYFNIPDSKLALYVQPSADGRVFVDGSTQYVWEDGVEPTVTYLTLDGSSYEEIVLPAYGFAIEERGDGAILYEHRERGAFTLHERLLDGTDREIWSCTAYMESIGERRAECNPNTIVWDESRNTVFWSMYLTDTVLEVDLDSGEAIRQFGQLPGGWTFDPEDSVVDYQHYVTWTTEGTILASTHVVGRREVQVCNEYVVDDANTTLTLAWQYESPDYYADYGGECHGLPNRNVLVGYGVDGAVVEVTRDQEVAWEVQWSRSGGTHLVGHMTLVDDLYALNGG